MDVSVGVERGEGGWDDGVPDDGFGGWGGGVARGSGVARGDVEEDLLGVPIE